MLIHNKSGSHAKLYRSTKEKKHLPARLMHKDQICTGYTRTAESASSVTLKGDYTDALISLKIDGNSLQNGVPSTQNPCEVLHFNGTLMLDGSPLSPALPPLCKIGDLTDSLEVKEGKVTFNQKIGCSDNRSLHPVSDFIGTTDSFYNSHINWELTESGFKQTKKRDAGYFRLPVYDITNLVEPNKTYFFYRNLSKNFKITNNTSNDFVGSILLSIDNKVIAEGYRWDKYLVFTTPLQFNSVQILTYSVPANNIIGEYTDGMDFTQFCLEWSEVGLYTPAKPNSAYLGTMTSGGKTNAQGVFTINNGETVKYPLAEPITTDLTNTEAGQMLLGINSKHGKDKVLSAPNGSLILEQYVQK